MKQWVPGLGLKVLALLLAFMVWFVVSAPRRENVSERTLPVPLSIVGMPAQLMITTAVPDTVNVRLRGRISEIRSLSSQNLAVTIDMRNWAQAGEAIITIRAQAINAPEGVEVVSVDPNKVRFRLEQVRQRVVSIRPFLVGDPPKGYTVGDPTVTPDQALVSGPVTQVRNLTEVATERIIMTGRTALFVQNVGVVSDSPLVRVVDPQTVEVTVPVLAEIALEPDAEPAPKDEREPATKTKRKSP
ncbi:MAG: CdaR family protein [Thermoanaerobaculia bacterium]